MISNDLVYRTHREWREADGSALFGGFARVLAPSPGSIAYRDPRPDRATAAAPLLSVGQRYESKHAPRTPEKTPTTRRVPVRWTPERIAALPRTSGQLTRIGDVINVIQCANRKTGKPRTEYTVACRCSCGKVINPQISTWVSMSRPRSCRPCVFQRQRKGSAFTDKGYAQGREFAAREKEQAA